MPPVLRFGTPVVIALTLALAPGAQASARCKVDQSPGAYGPTYTTGLTVSGVSCSDGKGLIRKWDRCRRRNGGRDGRCRRPGHGFRCWERRSNAISTQYDGRVRCTRGGDAVRFRYTQFT
jgi:hypothetical protein